MPNPNRSRTPGPRTLAIFLTAACLACSAGQTSRAAEIDELRVQREENFELAGEPTVVAQGDKVEITFHAAAWCDATVAIEDAENRIIRHLASGLLGPKAPAPFLPGTREQRLVWDGKDDHGRYVDDRNGLHVRVSLGLKPQYEKSLYYSPHKRIGEAVELLRATPEGVYVFDGKGVDHLRLFDHNGDYVRTVYPFPADKLDAVVGHDRRLFPQSNRELPVKYSLYQQTLLTSGDNASTGDRAGMTGRAATAMDVRDGQILLAHRRLNRLTTAGTTGGQPLTGPDTSVEIRIRAGYKTGEHPIPPTSMAISPDGRWAYLTGYAYRFALNFDCMSSVYRLPLQEEGGLELFAGGPFGESGEGDRELSVATSVDVDAAGRVYVTDYMNDRIQVFSPEGKLLKSIPVFKPALVRLHKTTGQMYVFSWLVCNARIYEQRKEKVTTTIPSRLTVLGAFDKPEKLAEYELPIPEFQGRYSTYTGVEYAMLYNAEIDSWTDPPTIWLSRDCIQNIERGVHPGDGGRHTPWDKAGLALLRPQADGVLEVVRDFGQEVVADPQVVRARPPTNAIQRLIVHPLTGKLYVGEADSSATIKAFKQLVEIDPETGQSQLIDTPFNALEAAFDLDGRIYLRTTNVVARYDFPSWREVPFDYGEELPKVGCGLFGRFAKVTSGLVMPAASPVCYHQGGFSIAPNGNIAASCAYRYAGEDRREEKQINPSVAGGGEDVVGKPYTPKVFPGRVFSSTGAAIHVWDRHGQILFEDAVPGVPQMDGIGIDRENNLYMMATPTRVYDGEKYFDEMSETLLKFRPGTSRVLSASKRAPVPLSLEAQPDTPPVLHNSTLGNAWCDDPSWLYGGVGFAGFNPSKAGGGCACWFARFTLDHFARSFAPEPLHFSVAVVDSAGNLITRIGQYGNEDSAGPDSPAPLPGDGVGLMHACYVGAHTDRRLFISDVGNGRIVSVKLNYHTDRRLPLPAAIFPTDR
ncbi:NHL repeat-containing protein [Lignipirellula cremea]|uniref:NHL repeat protein n=1 Tax=Lignipirellula cremea TaxID=2528010 RepID=A0A518DWD1_9BACT|nr:hypothetical protein [Lignipirellula cremea]QDU96139.1 hypothetical protein Pla8534_39580 [Lignipirellula cremea]